MAEHTKNSSEPTVLLWADRPYSVVTLGLKTALEERVRVRLGRRVSEEQKESLTSIIFCVDLAKALSDGIARIQGLWPDVPVLVFSLGLDLSLAQTALQLGARGFIHGSMTPEQVVRAVEVATDGQLVAPRELLEHLLYQKSPVDLNVLTVRQQEILGLVVEGLSNAEIARRLYLSESTIKQHLRAGYKLLGVKNRIDAARLIRGG